MASTRLTVAIKEKLVEQLASHAFAARSQDLFDRELIFAQEVYDAVMDTGNVRYEKGADKSLRKAIEALPFHWRKFSQCFRVEFAGQQSNIHRYDGVEVDYQENSGLVDLTKASSMGNNRKDWQFPPKWSSHTTLKQFGASDPISEKFTALHDEKKDLLEEISRARRTARVTMDSCSTVQELIVLWPEVEAFASKFLTQQSAASALLPTIAREQLNDALGLPPGAKAA